MSQNQQPAAGTQQQQPQPGAVVRYENIAENVLAKIKGYEQSGTMTLPQNYAVENQLKSAWLMLQDTVDMNKNKALDVCTKDSIANALLDMVLQGLSVLKKQAYFVVYGKNLTCVRSYFGTVSLAKQAGGVIGNPVANVIYEGDEFIYEISTKTGLINVIKHDQKFENINIGKIKGAYVHIQKGENVTEVTLMTIDQIRKSWEQGPMKGKSPAHINFTDEMCKKTVIGRACKMAINSSNDAWMYEGMKDEQDLDETAAKRDGIVNNAPTTVATEDIAYEDLGNGTAAPSQQAQAPAQPVADGKISGPGF